ncbi:hypothetical protein [Curtobacterium sp. ISL-83]|uniref:hypothetical protein n=1 Tax=Curtobacterium sp. ISL-83 TaxID=2819145 RepID=UPI001BEA1008|nr:hypothetical protein [Curtobacterium sp. ISL-83]MBT2501726.1 hypothetical protein [Curtobacterium sp. ISL-83]
MDVNAGLPSAEQRSNQRDDKAVVGQHMLRLGHRFLCELQLLNTSEGTGLTLYGGSPD